MVPVERAAVRRWTRYSSKNGSPVSKWCAALAAHAGAVLGMDRPSPTPRRSAETRPGRSRGCGRRRRTRSMRPLARSHSWTRSPTSGRRGGRRSSDSRSGPLGPSRARRRRGTKTVTSRLPSRTKLAEGRAPAGGRARRRRRPAAENRCGVPSSACLRPARPVVGDQRRDRLADERRDGMAEEASRRRGWRREACPRNRRDEDGVGRRFGERAEAQLALRQRLLRLAPLATDLGFAQLPLEDRARGGAGSARGMQFCAPAFIARIAVSSPSESATMRNGMSMSAP